MENRLLSVQLYLAALWRYLNFEKHYENSPICVKRAPKG